MNDVVQCVANALDNENIKGFEYSVRGDLSITYDEILSTLARYSESVNWKKCKRNLVTGIIENFFAGETHDKNIVKLLLYIEIDENGRMARKSAAKFQK